MDMDGALDRATATFAQTLAAVRDDQWDAPTPNPGWSVRDLVNHVVGGNRRYVLLLSGAPTVEVEALRNLEHLGTDPLQAFLDTSAAMTAAFHQPDVLAVTVHHRLGDRSGADLLVMRVMEHALHGWDLARSIDSDNHIDAARIDPGVTAALLAVLDADPSLLARSSYTPSTPPADIDPQRRLLILTGRST
jgi:uncharacterized protein (TIGR03086 family)